MTTVIGVSFKRAGKMYYFDPNGLELHIGDQVVVETARGMECGDVVTEVRQVEEDEVVQPLKPVLRVMTEEDRQRVASNEKKEAEAFVIGQQRIAHHKLEMKLVDVEYTFDLSKIIFYFTANGRIDFRELVKDLASIFKTRIELRQIGVRDEAKMIGGLGSCGRPICCRTFLGDFQPVSIKMAKEQNLFLNPAKISGICGRLLCCLFDCNGYRGACCCFGHRFQLVLRVSLVTKRCLNGQFRIRIFYDGVDEALVERYIGFRRILYGILRNH